jgi:uncharacterized protein (TIGR00304 family)
VFLAMADLFVSAGKETSQNAPPNEQGAPKADRSIEFGGVVFIGPIPILLGSSRKMVVVVIIIAAIVLAVMLLSLFFGRG